jgi:hypothetical protein
MATFQMLSQMTPETVADHLLDVIYAKVKAPKPARAPEADAMTWLNSGLREITGYLGNRKLVVIIDEFDALLGSTNQQSDLRQLFNNLRIVLRSQRDIGWILVVHDAFVFDHSRSHVSEDMLRIARLVQVRNLESRDAIRLIREPAERQSYRYSLSDTKGRRPAVYHEILEATGGNPWLIHLICGHLLDDAGFSKHISHSDLDRVMGRLLGIGRLFGHITDHIYQPTQRAILARVAAFGKAPVSSTALKEDLVDRFKIMTAKRMDEDLSFLSNVGLIEPEYAILPVQAYRIPMGLFRQWVAYNWNLEALLDSNRIMMAD